jgi:transcriptional regulator with XRE-family HTH domain
VEDRFSPMVPRLRVASTLRRLRERARMSMEEAAAELDISVPTLSRIETAKQGVNVHLVRSMLDLYQGTDHWREMLDLTRQSRRKGWWQEYGVKDASYFALETEASIMRNFEATLIPGLLQTESYTRALFAADEAFSDTDADLAVALRAVRQERLRAKPPLVFEAVVHEHALRLPVGGLAVMAQQLRHVAEVAELPNVTVQVVPTAQGAHPGVDGSFAVLSFDVDVLPDRIYVPHALGQLYVEKPEQVRAAKLRFDRLRAGALDPAASVDLVRRVAEELEPADEGDCDVHGGPGRCPVAAEQPQQRGQRQLRRGGLHPPGTEATVATEQPQRH